MGCQLKGYLVRYIKNYRVGREGYSDEAQFYAPYVIEFSDLTRWALFSTTSMRSDRVKGQQWDSINLKDIDAKITRAYLVYPDSAGVLEFQKKNDKIKNKEEYSALDAIISQDSLANEIERYFMREKSMGQRRDAEGRSFEVRVAETMAYDENLQKWRGGIDTATGVYYNMFSAIAQKLEINKKTTRAIFSTSDQRVIGLLPSGGQPKTDVIVKVLDLNGSEQIFTMSCKRSDNASVTVHQYSADSFADVLDEGNDKLRTLLNAFQEVGNKRDYGQDNSDALQRELRPYRRELALWVLGGYGGDGDALTQCASHLLTYNEQGGSFRIHRIDEYVDALLSDDTKGFFGTPFSWTYASGQRGKSIQLKCKII